METNLVFIFYLDTMICQMLLISLCCVSFMMKHGKEIGNLVSLCLLQTKNCIIIEIDGYKQKFQIKM